MKAHNNATKDVREQYEQLQTDRETRDVEERSTHVRHQEALEELDMDRFDEASQERLKSDPKVAQFALADQRIRNSEELQDVIAGKQKDFIMDLDAHIVRSMTDMGKRGFEFRMKDGELSFVRTPEANTVIRAINNGGLSGKALREDLKGTLEGKHDITSYREEVMNRGELVKGKNRPEGEEFKIIHDSYSSAEEIEEHEKLFESLMTDATKLWQEQGGRYRKAIGEVSNEHLRKAEANKEENPDGYRRAIAVREHLIDTFGPVEEWQHPDTTQRADEDYYEGSPTRY